MVSIEVLFYSRKVRNCRYSIQSGHVTEQGGVRHFDRKVHLSPDESTNRIFTTPRHNTCRYGTRPGIKKRCLGLSQAHETELFQPRQAMVAQRGEQGMMGWMSRSIAVSRRIDQKNVASSM